MINSVDEFIFYDDMQFTKRDWRNRNTIKTPQGLLWLTIPVKVKGKFLQKINETEVDGSDWAEKHWKTIRMNYSRSQHFKKYEDHFSELYKEASKLNLLSQVNFLFIKSICDILGIKTHLNWSHDYSLIDGKTERLANLCEQADADIYVSGPAAKSYIDKSIFDHSSIEVRWMNYSSYPEYKQLFGPFEHSVSILDMIFNLGDETCSYMKSYTGGQVFE